MDLRGALDLAAEAAVPLSDGSLVPAKVVRIVELVREYDHRLDVEWIPRDRRGADDPQFAIIERTPDGRKHIVFYVQDESQFDERVLARIYEADAQRHGNILSKIDAHNQAVKADRERQMADRRAEYIDFIGTAIRSPLHNFRHNGKNYGQRRG